MSAAYAVLIASGVLVASCSGGGGSDAPTPVDATKIQLPDPPIQQPATVIDAVPISSDAKSWGSHLSPSIVFNNSGAGLTVWSVYSGTGYRVLYSRYDAGNDTWSKEDTLMTSNNDDPAPQVATNGQSFAVTWTDRGRVMVRILSEASSEAVQINLNSTSQIFRGGNPRITSDGRGYLVAWEELGVRGSLFDGKQWSATPLQISAPDKYDADAITIAKNTHVAGNAHGYVTAWINSQLNRKANEYSGQILASVLSNGATNSWSPPQAVSGDYLPGLNWILDMCSNANLVAVRWNVNNTNYYNDVGIDAASVFDYRTLPLAWSSVEAFSSRSIGDLGAPSYLACSQDGASAIWVEKDAVTSKTSVFTKSYSLAPNGNPTWNAAVQLDGDAASEPKPRIASNGRGYAAAWRGSLKYLANTFENGAWSPLPSPIESGPANSLSIASNGNTYALLFEVGSWNSPHNVNATIHNDTGWTAPIAISGSFKPRASGGAYTNQQPVIGQDSKRYWFGWPVPADVATDQASTLAVRAIADDTLVSDIRYLSKTTYRGSAQSPRLIANESGALLALWLQYRDGGSELFARVRSQGKWGNTVQLSDPSLTSSTSSVFGQFTIRVAAKANTFAVVWSEQGKSFFRSFDGTQWGSGPTPIGPEGTGYSPDLIAHGTGYALCFNTFNTTTGSSTVGLGFFNNGQWNYEPVANYDGSADHTYGRVTLAQGPGDSIKIAWYMRDVTGKNYIAIRDWSNGNMGEIQTIPGPLSLYNLNLSLIPDASGGFALVWYNGFGGAYGSLLAAASTQWTLPILLTDHGYNFDMAPRSDGIVATWFQTPFALSYITAQNGTWSNLSSLPLPSPYSAYGVSSTPALATNGSRTLVSWSNDYEREGHIYLSAFDGNNWSDVMTHNNVGAEKSNQRNPDLIPLAKNYALTWEQDDPDSDASVRDVWVQLGGL